MQERKQRKSARARAGAMAAGLAGILAWGGAAFPAAAEDKTVATWFDGLGVPYGGCGIPQDLLETQAFVALNVYNTPGEYSRFPARPLAGADLGVMGAFENGRNCGRWVRVTLGPWCSGTNDGAPGQPFCRGPGAAWIDDAYSGGTLDLLVADSCGDGNAWCRDNPRHLDLSKVSLDRFSKNGAVLTGLNPDHWNNRAISWEYEAAPQYAGDVRIFFLKGTMKWWPAIAISHLPNGIHGVEQWVDGAWVAAERYSDLGQAFILKPMDAFRIRLIDAADKPVFGGREYAFDPPASCGGTCAAAATEAIYHATDPGGAGLERARGRSGLRVAVTAGGLRWEGQRPAAGDLLEIRDLRGRLAWRAWVRENAGTLIPLPADLAPGLYRAVVRAGAATIDAGLFARP